jgi:hypothetical protein
VLHAWIEEILLSARLFVLVNGKLACLFKCTCDVRKGDPLSPLLFCIAEEALSRSISNALLKGELSPMSLFRYTKIPSHVLYSGDIIVFCKGSKKNLCCIMCIFHAYVEVSGQVINTLKSKFYSGAVSNSRLLMIANLLGFDVGSNPFISFPILYLVHTPYTQTRVLFIFLIN